MTKIISIFIVVLVLFGRGKVSGLMGEVGKGITSFKKGLNDLAVGAIRQSVAADPQNPLYHYHLGLAYAKQGDKANARKSLEQALKMKPDFAGAGEAREVLKSVAG